MKLETSLIDRVLQLKKHLHFKSEGPRNALLSYVLFPPVLSEESWYFRKTHTNRAICKLFTEALVEIGFNVSVYSYLDEDIDTSVKYDLFIGHNIHFHKIAKKIQPGAIKVLLTTGSSPTYDNSQLARRNEALRRRRSVLNCNFYRPIEEPDYPYLNFKVADWVYMIGAPSIVSETWYPEFRNKFVAYKNLTQFRPTISKRKKKNDLVGANAFVYLSSVGNLRRGLDLVLETFSSLKDQRVFICGPYAAEREFCALYKKELFHTPNIVPMGFVDTNSRRFSDMIQESDFGILPSCSEGQSGSVLNLMSKGLMPVITKECGYENVNDYGFLIPGDSLDSVLETVKRAALTTEDQRMLKRRNLFLKSLEHTSPMIKLDFVKFLLSII